MYKYMYAVSDNRTRLCKSIDQLDKVYLFRWGLNPGPGYYEEGTNSLHTISSRSVPLRGSAERKSARALVCLDSVIMKRALTVCMQSHPGLFHRVIQQSGSPLAHWAASRHQQEPSFIYNIFTSSVDCHRNTSEETKRCIQALDSTKLENIIMKEFEVQ